MRKVIFEGCSDEQVRWGGNDDPRGVLKEGGQYEIERQDVHSWHTKVKISGVEGWFNSVCFRAIVEDSD